MKTSIVLGLLGLLLSASAQYYRGFNVGASLPSGACRTESDWEKAFNTIKSFPGDFTSARLYAASDCDTLANAVPAAIKTGVTILVGVWTEDNTHYEAEKQALLTVIQQYGSDWILAVSVGSEDLYRGDTDASTLASQIDDVRGMLWGLGAGSKQVGHVDTWTAWVDPANAAVIEASDFLGNDAYAYFEGDSIDNGAASDAYWAAVNRVRNVSQGRWVWTTETGWPSVGPPVGNAVPSLDALQTFWWQVACSSFESLHFFWYDLDDLTSSPSFAVVNSNYNPIIDMTCGS